jgi:hypothetical protein
LTNGDCRLSFNNDPFCVCNPGFVGDRCDEKFPLMEWMEWSNWSECSPDCGLIRSRNRTRQCPSLISNETDVYKIGKNCFYPGQLGHFEIQSCKFLPCIDEAHWSDWAEWSECSAVCNYGLQKRKRFCNYLYDINVDIDNDVGLPCYGDRLEFKQCKRTTCSHEIMGYTFGVSLILIIIPLIYSIIKLKGLITEHVSSFFSKKKKIKQKK